MSLGLGGYVYTPTKTTKKIIKILKGLTLVDEKNSIELIKHKLDCNTD